MQLGLLKIWKLAYIYMHAKTPVIPIQGNVNS